MKHPQLTTLEAMRDEVAVSPRKPVKTCHERVIRDEA